MVLSYNWLERFLNYKIDKNELSEILTSIGLEVESMYEHKKYKSDLDKCLVGEVLMCYKHPNADKLKVAEVSIGDKKILKIVCGAPNVREGLKVAVAMVGANLVSIDNQKVTIKKSKIRGECSDGMLCSPYEIGLGEDREGIWELDKKCEVGLSIDKYFENYVDTIYELNLTPNRADAFSHFGVAREVAAYLNFNNNLDIKVEFNIDRSFNTTNTNPISVEIVGTEYCDRFAGIYLSNIDIKPSPLWLRNYLESIKINSVNNVVDITNYILHSYGQPLHAYDANKISKNKLVVKNLEDNTEFTTLDNRKIKLSSEDVIICDGDEKPLCIAGVYGGINSGVKQDTKNIFIEAAVWNTVKTRKTSFRHSLRTQAAIHYERGIDLNNTLNVLKIASNLIIELAGGKIEGDFIDKTKKTIESKIIKTSFSFINRLIGQKFEKYTITKILKELKFSLLNTEQDNLIVEVPSHKIDVENPNDLVEEIIRIYGINKIKTSQQTLIYIDSSSHNKSMNFKNNIVQLFSSIGFNEILTCPLTNSKYFSEILNRKFIKLLNNVSEEYDILSPSSLHKGLESIQHNLNRKQKNIQFFEFSKEYEIDKEAYVEKEVLSIWIAGEKQSKHWNTQTQNFDLFDIKGYLNLLFCKLDIDYFDSKEIVNPYLENGFSIFLKDKLIGSYGYVKKNILNIFDIKERVIYAEIFWTELLGAIVTEKNFIKFSKFPTVTRDLSFTVDSGLRYSFIEKEIKHLGIKQLCSFKLFDLFENEKLGIGRKSMAIRFEFTDDTKTLTDKEVEFMISKVVKVLTVKFNIQIRK